MGSDHMEDCNKMQDALIAEAGRLRDSLGLDTVQIVVTFEVPGDKGWQLVSGGVGNFFARTASLADVIAINDEETRKKVREA